MDWHVITPEYPPQSGGVSDYTHLVASGLAAAETVHVWCPLVAEDANTEGVVVHRELGRVSPRDLRRVGQMLDRFPGPRRLLVQWVPHGFGYRSMNVPFCLWLWKRAKFRKDRVEIMVHEPFLAFGEGSLKQDLAAAIHRVMIIILLKAASRVWVSIPGWEMRLRPFALGGDKSFNWLPVPSNIPVVDNPHEIAKLRARYAPPEGFLMGHFGAYDDYMKELMIELLPLLLRGKNKLSVLLLGKGSLELRDQVIARYPDLRQIHATGSLPSPDISMHISACHLMLQPYQDGVSGRRGSVMAALAHGVSTVTTLGQATESCWIESQAVKLAKVGDIGSIAQATTSLLLDDRERTRLGALGKALYHQQFDVSRTISRLRGAA